MFKLKLPTVRPLLIRCISKRFCFNQTNQSNVTDEEKEKEIERITRNVKDFFSIEQELLDSASIDEPPTACCRTGCANCVFIVWAEALASKMENAGPEIIDRIMKSVDDPSMKAYLEMELRIRLKNK